MPRCSPTTSWTARLLAASTAAVLLTSTAAQAHTGLLSSSPADGEELAGAPLRVVLEFAEPVSAGESSVRVVDGAGVLRTEAVLLSHTGGIVSVLLADGGAAGVWQVRFDVRGRDGHLVGGGFDFGVDAAVDPGQAALPLLPSAAGALAALGAALLVLRRWGRRDVPVAP